MTGENEHWTDSAKRVLSFIYELRDHERVHLYLAPWDEKIKAVSPEVFGIEYLASRLALACVLWENYCKDHGIKKNPSENCF
ncbi:MAG: hypothetical protein NC930_04065 [Candidatus Omnitrophica bacterium]|nr:hypothetical protein [Candidatus Omnitrophota bacterium]